MQKLINVLALSSFLVSAAVVGGGVYIYLNKDPLIEKAKSQVMESIADILPGALTGGLGGDLVPNPTQLLPAPQRRLYLPLSTRRRSQLQIYLTPPSDMFSTVHYFVSLVLVLTNCVSPVNWKHCAPVHEWFPPYFNDYTEYISKWG